MALEYKLQIKTKMPLYNFVESYINSKNICFSKEDTNKVESIYLYESLGFMITFLFSEKIFFDYLLSKNQSREEEWDYSAGLYFRLDKVYDNLLARSNMIDICVFVLKNTNEDALLLFNGDILVLERTDGIIHINENFDFWNSKKLLNKLEFSSPWSVAHRTPRED